MGGFDSVPKFPVAFPPAQAALEEERERRREAAALEAEMSELARRAATMAAAGAALKAQLDRVVKSQVSRESY
eukprot:1189855-Prorocentrum_minimum.AAC.2